MEIDIQKAMTALKEGRVPLRDIPQEFRSDAVITAIIKKHPDLVDVTMGEMKEEQISDAIAQALASVGQLHWIPKERLTPMMVSDGVRAGGRRALDILYPTLSEAHIVAAVMADEDVLWSTPIEQRTEAVCLASVRRNGVLLRYVPYEHRTEAICLTAVEQDGIALEYVPYEHRTEAMCVAAVKEDALAIKYMTEDQRTDTVCWVAVRREPRVIGWIPEEQRTLDLCREAARRSSVAWKPSDKYASKHGESTKMLYVIPDKWRGELAAEMLHVSD